MPIPPSAHGRTTDFMAKRWARDCASPRGTWDIGRLWTSADGATIGRLAAGCAQVPPTHRGLTIVDPGFVAGAHRRRLQVNVWSINEAAKMNRLLDVSIDGLMSDRPSLLRQVLRERGPWTGG